MSAELYRNLKPGQKIYSFNEKGEIKEFFIFGKNPANERFYLANPVDGDSVHIFHWDRLRRDHATTKEQLIKYYNNDIARRQSIIKNFS